MLVSIRVYRLVLWAFLAAIGIANGESPQIDATSLQREVAFLQEQLELFEMKHNALQAASQQFRKESESARSKLEEERKRFQMVVSEKRSLEESLKVKLENALQYQKATLEESLSEEHSGKYESLAKEHKELSKKLHRSEYQISLMERTMEERMQDQSNRYTRLEERRKAAEDKMQEEISDLKQRLTYSETQAQSFEESWKNAMGELKENEDFLRDQSIQRVQEADKWEERVVALNQESKKLYEETTAKDQELKASNALHASLAEKVHASDTLIEKYEEEILQWKISTETFIEEKAEMTLAYKQVIQELRTKNDLLHTEIVDLKFQLERVQNETQALHQENANIATLRQKTMEDLEIMTVLFQESERHVRNVTAQVEEEKTRNAILQWELVEAARNEERLKEFHSLKETNRDLTQLYQESERKLEVLEADLSASKRNHQDTLDRIATLQTNAEDLEIKIKTLNEQLEWKEAKNSYLQKALVETKHNLNESQNKLTNLEDESQSRRVSTAKIVEDLAIENERLNRRIEALQVELTAKIETTEKETREADSTIERVHNKTAMVEAITFVRDETTASIDDEPTTMHSVTQEKVETEDLTQRLLDYVYSFKDALHRGARVVVDSIHSTGNVILVATVFYVRQGIEGLAEGFKSTVTRISGVLHELRIVHFALVSLFEFELTFVASLLSEEKDRSGLEFLIRHSNVAVTIGEILSVLLCIDFVYASFSRRKGVKRRRPRAKTIPVPKTANASLLRKANNM